MECEHKKIKLLCVATFTGDYNVDNNDKHEDTLAEIQKSNAHHTSIFFTITLSRFCLLSFGNGSRTCLANTEAKCFLITAQS